MALDQRKVFLREEECQLSGKELMTAHGLSKATAHRALKRGWYWRNYHGGRKKDRVNLADLPPAKEIAPGEEVVLSELERKLTRNQLACRYQIGKEQAKEALRTGVVRRSLRFRVARKLPSAEKWTAATPRDYDPESRHFRVNLAPAECGYSVERLMQLYAAFGLSEAQAFEARLRGYFCPNASGPREVVVDEEVFALLAEDCLKSAEEGARSALYSFFGPSWQQVLRGVSFSDVSAAALDRLRELSGREEIAVERWRFVVARFAAKRFIGERLKEQRQEATTVDEMEGRFDED